MPYAGVATVADGPAVGVSAFATPGALLPCCLAPDGAVRVVLAAVRSTEPAAVSAAQGAPGPEDAGAAPGARAAMAWLRVAGAAGAAGATF